MNDDTYRQYKPCVDESDINHVKDMHFDGVKGCQGVIEWESARR